MGRKKRRTARSVRRTPTRKEFRTNPNLPFIIRVIAEIPLVYLNLSIYFLAKFKKSSFNVSSITRSYNKLGGATINKYTISLSKYFKKLENKYKKAYILRSSSNKKTKKRIKRGKIINDKKKYVFPAIPVISLKLIGTNLKDKIITGSAYIVLIVKSTINNLKRFYGYLDNKQIHLVKPSKKEVSSERFIDPNIISDSSKETKTEEDKTDGKQVKNNNILDILFKTVISVLLFPFIIVYKIFHSIFTFELKFRLFSIKTFALLIMVGVFYIISVFYLAILKDIPSPDSLNQHDSRLTTRIYDRKGNLLYRVYDNEDRTLVELENIPTPLVQATIAIEDASFYEHSGLSVRGILRATKRTFLEEDMQGGSTITQQLVKNTLLSPERTYERKLKEAILSVELERRYSKNEILEMYLNKISYGGTAHGVNSAAKKYFGKELSELTLAESAYMAGLPAAPSTYSPFSGNPQLGKMRQADVLRRMVEINAISPEEAKIAFQEKLVFNDQTQFIKAPHFVNYVITELESKYGQQLIAQGGLDIYTSLDLELQYELEEIVKEQVNTLRGNNVNNGAVVVTNPKSGEILAMVGSVDYWDVENDGNVNVTVSPRQPGSSIKPLTYALALENGYSPTSKIEDTPVTYSIAGSRPYAPRNYDNSFHGTVTLTTALANSYNVPAVKLLNTLGVENYIDFAKNLGISTWNERSRYGLSLTLGAGEVKMIDMAEAYGTFANLGYKQEVNPILKIYDPLGNVLEENTCVDFLKESPSILTRKTMFETAAIASTGVQENRFEYEGIKCPKERVISEKTAFHIGQMLSNNSARTPAFGSNSGLYIPTRQVAVKTGTTSNLKDNWAIGFTNDYVVVAWIGNNNGDQMRNVVSGYRGASNIWRATFDHIIEEKDVNTKLSIPSNMVEVEICPLTNTLACSACNNIKQYFIKGEEPKVACKNEDITRILKAREEEKKRKEKEEDKEDD